MNEIVQFRCEGVWKDGQEGGEEFTNLEAEDRNDAFSDGVREDDISNLSAFVINSGYPSGSHLLECNVQ